jgi:hypothetical protein
MAPRMGRPREFKRRVRLTVFFEPGELRRLQAVARAERLSAAKWARQRLLAALAGSAPSSKGGSSMKHRPTKETAP